MARNFLALAAVFACLGTADAFKAMPRKDAVRLAAAALVSPALLVQPASAKSKRTAELEKAEAEAKAQIAATTGLAAGAAGKGLRGTGNPDFDKNDTVQSNRDKNKGLARGADGKKIVVADRNPSPESLGLKQWNGSL